MKGIKGMKKIIIVSDRFGMGGLERVTSLIGNRLSDKNQVLFFSISEERPFYQLNAPISFYKNQSFREKIAFFFFRVIRKFSLNIFNRNIVFLKKPEKQIFKKIVHYNIDTIVLTGWSILFATYYHNRFPGTTIILWMHNSYKVYFEDYFLHYKGKLISSMNNANKVVALTEEDKNGFGSFSKNVIKISNPITLENNQHFSILKNKTISITCRYAIEHKGLDYLVQIAKLIPDDWKIAVAGSGSPEEVKEFEALISKAGVTDKFILRGALSGDDLLKHYQESSIYVMTSRWEGLPLVLTEAMSFGLPIISFENSGANEVLENGKYGILVEQGNVEEFSRQLNRMIESKELREEYSKKSLERVKDFSIEKIIKQWEEII